MKSALIIFAFLGVAFARTRDPRCNLEYNFQRVGQTANLTSPNWPSSYPNDVDCLYRLSSPVGTQIEMACDINIEYAQRCVYDQLTVSLSGNSALTDGRGFCGNGRFSQTSNGNSLAIGFRSDDSNPRSSSPYRYTCMLTVVSTGQPPAESDSSNGGSSGGSNSGAFSNTTCTCGIRNSGRIVGGEVAELNEFPWRVGLYSRDMGIFCGGTIISPNYVLTAAHCIGATGAWTGSYPLMVNVGDHDYSTTSETRNQVIAVSQVQNHPQYNSRTQDNDVALLRLERSLVYSSTIQPICLPWNMRTQQEYQGRTVTASGWGTTSSGGSTSPVLRRVDLPILTRSECDQYYPRMLTDNMICTYSPGEASIIPLYFQNRKDTCQGDSGGSIDLTVGDRMFHAGVVSWGVGCAGESNPGVYSFTANYLPWIEQSTAGDQFCR